MAQAQGLGIKYTVFPYQQCPADYLITGLCIALDGNSVDIDKVPLVNGNTYINDFVFFVGTASANA